MRVSYHPDFPKDIKRFEAQYGEISPGLALRFRREVDKAIERIKAAPVSAGHFVNTDSQIVKEVRRRNLSGFPFFVLCGVCAPRERRSFSSHIGLKSFSSWQTVSQFCVMALTWTQS